MDGAVRSEVAALNRELEGVVLGPLVEDRLCMGHIRASCLISEIPYNQKCSA